MKIEGRSLKIPTQERIIGWVGDNRVEVRIFELNRFYGDIDLSEFDFKLDTEINGTKNIIDLDKSVTEDKITLTWTVKESHILNPGHMSIQIRAFSAGEEKWHSAQGYVKVQPSINAEQSIPDPLPSEFVQMEARVTVMRNEAVGAAGVATEQANRALGIADTFENETLPAAIQAVQDAGQEKVDEAAQQVDRVQGIIDEAEQEILPELRQAIEDGGLVKTALDGSIETAGTAKTQLDSSIASAGTAKTQLEGTITQASNAKGQVDDSVSQAGTVKTELEGSIATAGQVKEALDESIQTGDLEAFRNDYNQFKNDSILKTTIIEKEFNDYKSVIAGLNPNQEVKQKVEGYGVVSLPKNAANGQVSATVKGRTLKNEMNYNRDTWTEWEGNITSRDSSGIVITDGAKYIALPTSLKPSTKYGILTNVISNNFTGNLNSLTSALGVYKICSAGQVGNFKNVVTSIATITSNKVGYVTVNGTGAIKLKDIRVFELPTGSEIENDFETMTADQLAIKYPYISGDSVKSTICAGRITCKNEDETEQSQLYYVAKDPETGEILEARSVPNGTKDEIRVADKKLIKRCSDVHIFTGNEEIAIYTQSTDYIRFKITMSNMDTARSISNFICFNNFQPLDIVPNPESEGISTINGYFYISILKSKLSTVNVAGFKAWLQANPTSLTYQLAEPIEIPIQVSGSLISHPNGTVYVEPIVADAGVYTDKIEVLHQDLPIKALEKLSKVDFMTGVETELDINQAEISEDKLSFTHPELNAGDIVFFEYEYDVESTIPETEIEYYDSRYVIKDSVTDKFYKWNVTVADGVPSIELVEV